MNSIQTLAAAALATALFAACSSVGYRDPDSVERINSDFGSTEVQTFADTMADSLLASPNLNYLDQSHKGADKRIIAVFGGIANETREHINTAMISRRMVGRLTESGKMRVVAGKEADGQDEILDQIRFQRDSGMVNPEMRQRASQLGAEIIVFGSLAQIYKERGRSIESGGSKRKDNYMQLFMSAVRVDTGEILWSREEDVAKTEVIGLFGG